MILSMKNPSAKFEQNYSQSSLSNPKTEKEQKKRLINFPILLYLSGFMPISIKSNYVKSENRVISSLGATAAPTTRTTRRRHQLKSWTLSQLPEQQHSHSTTPADKQINEQNHTQPPPCVAEKVAISA